MPAELVGVFPGDQGVYRLAWQSSQVFAPPPWTYSDPDDGTFGNRFDDPTLENGNDANNRFRMIYCATDRVCALYGRHGALSSSTLCF